MTDLDKITEKIVRRRANRREFVTRIGAAGLGLVAGNVLAGCGGSGGSLFNGAGAATNTDQTILNAAATAEALATVYYDNVIKSSPAYTQLNTNMNDQAYLLAGRHQEFDHYNALVSLGAVPLTKTFYFPTTVFTDATFQATVDTLVTLEDTFIAAYLIAVRDFSSSTNKVYAAQILGVESEHRAFGRVIAADLGLTHVSGQAGSETITPNGTATAANNISYERTFSTHSASVATGFKTISDIVTALGPFVTAGAAGFSATAHTFDPVANNYAAAPPTLNASGPGQ